MTVRCLDFEELTLFKEVGKKPGTFYAQSFGTPKLVLDAKSKTYDWAGGYFLSRSLRILLEIPRSRIILDGGFPPV